MKKIKNMVGIGGVAMKWCQRQVMFQKEGYIEMTWHRRGFPRLDKELIVLVDPSKWCREPAFHIKNVNQECLEVNGLNLMGFFLSTSENI